ncbi:unnamed protein product [Acanthoscelides obtectus]|uniref:MGAT4 A/B/C C-terminal domain-containing protein n=1 Tax=Acanthoscelides obtectus TaxID=200917 RepID=A0A9P0L8C5_ACAOB|nr:unnamed protein product [Acanthoscelides obtectus]CAK1645819.1 hypothetical protein AOBTE_LOCUS14295 [Acanthoscelides obtectus]
MLLNARHENQLLRLGSINSFFTGKFDSAGVAQGSLDESIGKIQVLRLNVHSESDNWAILSEIHIQDELAAR